MDLEPATSRLTTMPQGFPKYTLGFEAIHWATMHLRHPNGPRAGQRWQFIESQADFLLWWYAVDEDGKWLYHHSARRLAKGAGKALALDTPIPTPTGWTTMGALVYGDDVLDENGDPCRVMATTAEMAGHDCYDVVFKDGSLVVADGNHLWPLIGYSENPGHVSTTREIAEKDLYAQSSTIASIRRARSVPVRCITVDSPSSLYLCGRSRVPTHNSPFAGLVALVELCAPVRLKDFDPKKIGGVVGKPVDMPWVQIAATAASQPLALDTPVPTPAGFRTVGDLAVGDEVFGSDGRPVEVRRTTPVFLGQDCYKVTFDDKEEIVASEYHGWSAWTDGLKGLAPFTTEQMASGGPYWVPQVRIGTGISIFRRILSVVQVESVPVRCIGIDNEDHLFAVGNNFVLTKNTANTMRMVRAFATKGSRVQVDYKLDPGITKIHKPPNGLLEVITSSASTAEGAEISFSVEDEVEHWIPASGGPLLAETIDRNLAKSGSRAMETSNAWEPGQGSVAEATYDAWVLQEEGRTRGKSKILYDARIAPPDTDLADEASLIKGLAHAYGDCNWVDLNVLKERVWSPKTRPEVARRFYLNQPTASEESWVSPMEWAACADTSRLVEDEEDVVMFFDGSKSRDATALMGCCMSDGYVFTLGVWEPDPKHDTESVIPVASVDAAVAQAFDRFTVLAFFADVQEWEGYVKTTWPERYRDQLLVWASPNTKESHPIAWDMRTRTYDFTMAVELTHEDIVSRKLTHDGDSRVARHVINAHRRPNRWGLSIGKETRDSPKKVDAAVCVVGARMVRRLVMSSSEWDKRKEPVRTGRVFGF